MTNEEKLIELIKFLGKNKIRFKRKTKQPLVDLCVRDYNINVHLSDEHNDEFYELMGNSYPVFIRDEDSAEFVIEKVQNTILKVLDRRQQNYERKLKAKEARKLQSETQK